MKRRSLLGPLATAFTLPGDAWADTSYPRPIQANLVVTRETRWQGFDCLAIELTDEEQALRLRDAGGGNRPSIATVHPAFADGTIEAFIGAELTGKGALDDRGFAGLSFHIGDGFTSHETVYLRMTNGRLNRPPPPAPRIDRAIQYVADPGFHFSESREKFPGRYEKGADIAVGRWQHLRLEISARRLRALVDGVEVLTVDDLRYPGRASTAGMFVGDGSRAFFREVVVRLA